MLLHDFLIGTFFTLLMYFISCFTKERLLWLFWKASSNQTWTFFQCASFQLCLTTSQFCLPTRINCHPWNKAHPAMRTGTILDFLLKSSNWKLWWYFFFRSLVENMNYFKEEMYALREQNRSLQHRLEDEISARKRLESIMRCNLLSNRQDIEWND